MLHKIKKRDSFLPYLYIFSGFLVYLGVYSVRELLGAVSPSLLEAHLFDAAGLGVLSSVMFISYGVGQLVNGFLGEKLNVKLMITLGLVASSLCTLLFAVVDSLAFRYLLWTVCGFALSMIYGPLTKSFSTHLSDGLARIGYNFLIIGAILGATVAGFIVGLCNVWYESFFIMAAALAIPLLIFFITNRKIEKRIPRECTAVDGDCTASAPINTQKFSFKTFFSCFGITTVCFLIVNMLIKASRNAVAFWASTYLSSALGFDSGTAAIVFGAMATIKVVAPFFALWAYKLAKENERVVIFVSLLISSICFMLMIFVKGAMSQIALFTVALFFVECGGSLIGSVFLLHFKHFGCVSAICGFFDSMAYLVAAICSMVFSNVLAVGGWAAVLWIWVALPAVAATVISIVLSKRRFCVSADRTHTLYGGKS